MSFQVTIPADDTQGCVEVPVTDDDLAMEGDEVFQISLLEDSLPPGVQPESDEPSTITIIDDDGKFIVYCTILTFYLAHHTYKCTYTVVTHISAISPC